MGLQTDLENLIFVVEFQRHKTKVETVFCRSEEWNSISEERRKELGLVFDDDGEFWISYKDLLRNFTAVEVCSLSPDDLIGEEEKEDVRTSWKTSMFEGSWAKDISAGGCRNHPGKLHSLLKDVFLFQ